MRTETRKERYEKKALNARRFPVSLVATNFTCDGNVAYLARALACFGGNVLHIIGKIPERNELKRLSGGHSELVTIIQHKNPVDFVEYCAVNNFKVISAELSNAAINIHEYDIPLDREVVFAVGNEMDGLPTEVVLNSDTVYIPMVGTGFCLNTSQTANILLYEYNRRVFQKEGLT